MAQGDETMFLAYKVPTMVCPSCDFHVLDKSVRARVDEILNEPETSKAEVSLWRYSGKDIWEDD